MAHEGPTLTILAPIPVVKADQPSSFITLANNSIVEVGYTRPICDGR